jgi:hypothetical protein
VALASLFSLREVIYTFMYKSSVSVSVSVLVSVSGCLCLCLCLCYICVYTLARGENNSLVMCVCVIYVYIYICIHIHTCVCLCPGAMAAALIIGPNGRQGTSKLLAHYGLHVQTSVNKLLDTIAITAGRVTGQLQTTIAHKLGK